VDVEDRLSGETKGLELRIDKRVLVHQKESVDG